MAKKSQAVLEAETRAGQLQMSLLNMRQMYEGAVQEKMALKQQLEQSQALVAALIFPDPTAFVQKDALDAIAAGAVEGMNLEVEEDGLHVIMVYKEDEDESDEE